MHTSSFIDEVRRSTSFELASFANVVCMKVSHRKQEAGRVDMEIRLLARDFLHR